MKLLLIAAVALVPTVLAGSDETDYKIMEFVDVFNMYSQCWGVKAAKAFHLSCMMYAEQCVAESNTTTTVADSNTTTITKRQADDEDATEISTNEIMKLVAAYKEYNELSKDKMDTLFCVLKKFGFLDSAGNIDIEAVVAKINSHTENAGADPEFMSKLTTNVRDCYDVSMSWPQVMLDRYPWSQKYGRQHIFISCCRKMEEKMCYKYMVKMMMDLFYGKMDNVDHEKYGFPADKYEAAYMSLRAKYETTPMAQKFVHTSMFSKAKFL